MTPGGVSDTKHSYLSSGILSIDPGLTGGVVLTDDLLQPIWHMPLPVVSMDYGRGKRVDPVKLSFLIRDALRANGIDKPDHILLEHPLPLPGISNQSIATTFMNWGLVYASLLYLDFPVTLVTPSEWTLPLHEHFHLTGKDMKAKQKTRVCFHQLYPHLPKSTWRHDGKMDALMMAVSWVWQNKTSLSV